MTEHASRDTKRVTGMAHVIMTSEWRKVGNKPITGKNTSSTDRTSKTSSKWKPETCAPYASDVSRTCVTRGRHMMRHEREMSVRLHRPGAHVTSVTRRTLGVINERHYINRLSSFEHRSSVLTQRNTTGRDVNTHVTKNSTTCKTHKAVCA